MINFKKQKPGTKVGIIAGLILFLIVFTKLSIDFIEWTGKQIDIARKVSATTDNMEILLDNMKEFPDDVQEMYGTDVWGNELIFTRLTKDWKTVQITSLGPDGCLNTSDDIKKSKYWKWGFTWKN